MFSSFSPPIFAMFALKSPPRESTTGNDAKFVCSANGLALSRNIRGFFLMQRSSVLVYAEP